MIESGDHIQRSKFKLDMMKPPEPSSHWRDSQIPAKLQKIKTEIRNCKKREPLDLNSLIELADPRIQRRALMVIHGQCNHMGKNKKS
jgi:hypothetical protein